MISDERIREESEIDPSAGHAQHTEDLPRRKPWFRLSKRSGPRLMAVLS
jgi:hypothetical protein